MTVYRRYRILQYLVFAQGLAVVLFGVYVLLSSKKRISYEIQYHEPAKIDLSFLDVLTNRHTRAESPLQDPAHAVADPSRPSSVYTPIFPSPFVFDGYFRSHGVAYAVLRGFYYKAGDYIHGRLINSVSPAFVEIEGRFYPVRAVAEPPSNTEPPKGENENERRTPAED